METKLPTIHDFHNIWNKAKKTNNNFSDYIPEEILWQSTISLFNKFPEFFYFIKAQGHEDIVYAYLTFPLLIDYIDYLYKKNQLWSIQNLLQYLDSMLNSNNLDIVNLVDVCVLENFDRLNCYPQIKHLITDRIFIELQKYYPYYLKV